MTNVRKAYFILFLIIGIFNSNLINCRIGAFCNATPDCETGEQCENGFCIKRCSRDSDCPGRPGRTGACSQGYCLAP